MSTSNRRHGDAFVLFGITGDLAYKMLLPALYEMDARGELNVPIVGVALTDLDLDGLKKRVLDSLRDAKIPTQPAVLARFLKRIDLEAGNFGDPETFRALATKLKGAQFPVFYLAVPPSVFGIVAGGLAAAGLAASSRLVVEKPFGHDMKSALELDAQLKKHFPEERLFRVDHFLGKEAVEDIMIFRFANMLLEPIWNSSFIRTIQITMAESFGCEGRGNFYDPVGAVRDVVQNHLLQVLTLLTMEPPATSDPDSLLDEKYKVLHATRPIQKEDCIRGRYTGYAKIPGVKRDSKTETFAAMRLFIENWRWHGVPISLRAGKMMSTTSLEVVVALKRPPVLLFTGGAGQPDANLIRFRLGKHPGVTFGLRAKQPGVPDRTTGVVLSTDFETQLKGVRPPYEHIFRGALDGDPRQFGRMDVVKESWRIVEPILNLRSKPLPYAPGTMGPKEADQVALHHHWHTLEISDPKGGVKTP